MVASPKNGVTLFVDSVEKNLEYFTKTLGFTEVQRMEHEGETVHGQVAFGRGPGAFGVGFASMRGVGDSVDYDFGEFGRTLKRSPDTRGNGVFLRFTVPSVDKYHQKIRRNAIIDEPPTDQPWGQRTISVLTPDGYYLTFAQPIKGFRFPRGSGLAETRGGRSRRAASGRAKRR